MKLEGKVAIVTGAGGGIGRGIALCLAEEGADVVVNSLHEETSNRTAADVKALGRRALAIVADITESEQIARVVQETLNTFGKIDILVNNVGGAGKIVGAKTSLAPFISQTEAEWDEGIELNFKTQVLMCQAVVPHFLKQKSGKIVNIASNAARFVKFHSIPGYEITKGAVVHLTKCLATELAAHNINVNAVCPGGVYTPLLERLYTQSGQAKPEAEGMTGREYFLKFSVPRFPMKREQTPEDVGKAVVFLASEDARNITGQALYIDQGQFM